MTGNEDLKPLPRTTSAGTMLPSLSPPPGTAEVAQRHRRAQKNRQSRLSDLRNLPARSIRTDPGHGQTVLQSPAIQPLQTAEATSLNTGVAAYWAPKPKPRVATSATKDRWHQAIASIRIASKPAVAPTEPHASHKDAGDDAEISALWRISRGQDSTAMASPTAVWMQCGWQEAKSKWPDSSDKVALKHSTVSQPSPTTTSAVCRPSKMEPTPEPEPTHEAVSAAAPIATGTQAAEMTEKKRRIAAKMLPAISPPPVEEAQQAQQGRRRARGNRRVRLSNLSGIRTDPGLGETLPQSAALKALQPGGVMLSVFAATTLFASTAPKCTKPKSEATAWAPPVETVHELATEAQQPPLRQQDEEARKEKTEKEEREEKEEKDEREEKQREKTEVQQTKKSVGGRAEEVEVDQEKKEYTSSENNRKTQLSTVATASIASQRLLSSLPSTSKVRGRKLHPETHEIFATDWDLSSQLGRFDGIAVQQLAKMIASDHLPSLNTLDLSGMVKPAGTEALLTLLDALPSLNHLRRLGLSGTGMGPKTLVCLAKNLADMNSSLAVLDLSKCLLTGSDKYWRRLDTSMEGFESLCAVVGTDVIELNLSGCGLGPAAATELRCCALFQVRDSDDDTDTVATTAAHVVSLQSNPLGSDGAQFLARGFQLNTRLRTLLGVTEKSTTLDLSCDQMNLGLQGPRRLDEGLAQLLVAEMQACRAATMLQHINLSYAKLGVQGGTALVEGVFSTTTNLETIVMGKNLTLPLKEQREGTTLDASDQHNDPGFVVILAWWLSTPAAARIVDLNLSGCGLSGAIAASPWQLAKGLKGRFQDIDSELAGLGQLCKVLSRMQTVTLNNCGLGVASLIELAKVIGMASSQVATLNLDGNDLFGINRLFQGAKTKNSRRAKRDMTGWTSLCAALKSASSDEGSALVSISVVNDSIDPEAVALVADAVKSETRKPIMVRVF